MATWGEMERAQPGMAELLRSLLEQVPIAYLATVRRDGSPRVHPVCPIFAGDGMYVAVAGESSPQPSPKRFDLARDGRFALHAMPGHRDDEFYVTGRARFIDEGAERNRVVGAAGHTVRDGDWVFELGIDFAMTAYWENIGQPDTYPVRTYWRPTT
jgi:hypothetical protein